MSSSILLAALLIVGVAIAAGAIDLPDLAGRFSDAADSLDGWIYPAAAALIFVETTTLVGFVVHGELVLLIAAVTAERSDALPVLLIAVAAAAAVTGDVVSFLGGRRLGRPFLEHRIGSRQLARIDTFFARHGTKAIVLGRFTGFLRATMPFVLGSSGLALRRMLPLSAISALAWVALFTGLGYAFSESVTGAGETATRVLFATALLITAAFVIRSRWRTS